MPDERLTAAAEPAPALAVDEVARATLLNDELIDRTLIRNCATTTAARATANPPTSSRTT